MKPTENPSAEAVLRNLADFRYQLRRFLHFSEEAATRFHLPSQQHQLLLQIAGAAPGEVTSVAYLANRLCLRHHTVVELAVRCEQAGLVFRRADPLDRRVNVLDLTETGRDMLAALAEDHARELHELGPRLIQALRPFVKTRKR
jgi:DNA-binding MarR family transcriptional regulator